MTTLKMISNFSFSPLISLALIITMQSSLANTLLVPSQYTTIQDAISAAMNGDTVLVSAGTYTGTGNRDIELLGKSIVVMSESGPQVTIIDCGTKTNRGFYIHQGEDTTTVISGFKIINANDAIYCDDSAIISGCMLENNLRGLTLNTTAAHIRHCRITSNGGSGGTGIRAIASPDAKIQNCVVAFNQSTTGNGGGIYVQSDDSPWIINCTLTQNYANTSGGGVWLTLSGTLRIKNSIIWNNTANTSPNIKSSLYDISYCNITDSIFSGVGNFSENPRFADPTNSDFHLSSISTCIDAGDPNDDYSHEPTPNGGRINLGAYGNTTEATSFAPQTTIDSFRYSPTCDPSIVVSIYGIYFGENQLSGSALINNQNIPITSWSDTMIVMNAPTTLIGDYDIIVNSDAFGSDTIIAESLFTPNIQYVSGNVSGIWTASCPGIYILTDNTTVPSGDTLIIEPGVQILSNIDSSNSVTFTVNGTLIAQGTVLNQIIFSVLPQQESAGSWNGILLNMQAFGDHAILENCIVKNATIGITIRDSDALIKNCTIQNNSSHGVEFRAWGENVNGSLENCIIQNNEGWGIHCEGFTSGTSGTAMPTIQNNVINYNGSGGILAYGHASTPISGTRRTSGNSNPKILRNLIHNNNGYAIRCLGIGDFADASPFDLEYIGRASPYIEGNLIRNNSFGVQSVTVPGGPNDWLAYAEPNLINNTFWNNGPIDLFAGDSTTITVVNSIFWDGLPSSIQSEGNGKVNISYSNFDSLYAGEGNISADPAFFDPSDGDFRLEKFSPCIDAGTNEIITDTLDYLGQTRIQDGNFDDSLQVDMGAIESDGSCLNVPTLTWIGAMNIWNVAVNWDLSYIPNLCSDISVPMGQVTIQNGQKGLGKSIEVQLGAALHVELGAEIRIGQ